MAWRLPHPEDREHIGALHRLNEEQRWVVTYLYERLTILDGKFSGILFLNSILVGVVSFSLSGVSISPGWGLLVDAFVIIWLLSTALCLWTHWLTWRRLHGDAKDFDTYAGKISSLTVRRTRIYNVAVVLTAFLMAASALLMQLKVPSLRGERASSRTLTEFSPQALSTLTPQPTLSRAK